MLTNAQAVEIIEAASREIPTCDCGAPTIVNDHDGAIFVECSTLENRPGGLRRILHLDFPTAHVRRVVIDSTEAAIAA